PLLLIGINPAGQDEYISVFVCNQEPVFNQELGHTPRTWFRKAPRTLNVFAPEIKTPTVRRFQDYRVKEFGIGLGHYSGGKLPKPFSKVGQGISQRAVFFLQSGPHFGVEGSFQVNLNVYVQYSFT